VEEKTKKIGEEFSFWFFGNKQGFWCSEVCLSSCFRMYSVSFGLELFLSVFVVQQRFVTYSDWKHVD
jgi:uncharacterized protein YdaL